jgi:hypothetical protein
MVSRQYFSPGSSRESIEDVNCHGKFTFQAIWSFFAWHDGRDYRQWHLKSCFSWA